MIPHLLGLTTIQDRLLWLLILFTTAKILSTATLVILGDYRAARIFPFRRIAGITSKVTPSLMCLAEGSRQFTLGNPTRGWVFLAGSIFIAGFATFVVKLRSRGKFYGAADWMLLYLSPRQVKVVTLALISILFILALRAGRRNTVMSHSPTAESLAIGK